MRRRNPHAGLVVFWVKPMQRGYSRSITGLYRFLKKQGIMASHPPNPKYVPKPYEQMDHPGQRLQVDVKFVSSACLVNSRVAELHPKSWTHRPTIGGTVLWEKNFSQKDSK